MHDCRQIKAQLLDLVFDELSPPASQRLHTELETCADCQAEYRTLNELLRVCDQASAAAQPPADFWPGYHARLAAHLRVLAPAGGAARAAAAPAARRASASVWQRVRATAGRAFNARLGVPVPAALAVALALVVTTVLALRPAPAPVDQSAQTRIIEVPVPVVQEKIVTRTVYVTRPTVSTSRQAQQTTRVADARTHARWSPRPPQAASPRVVLTGFQPTGEVQLRVIKERLTNEQ